MDKDHRLDAPDNESLSTIEQISDHSELTTIYPHAHLGWEKDELISHDEREKRRNDERLRISLSLRKWFLVIGILIPLPILFMGFLVSIAPEIFDMKKLQFMALPVLIATGFFIFLTYKGFKYAFKIFYKHGTKPVPFILALLGLLALSTNAVFLLTEPLHTGHYAIDSVIVDGGLLVASILYSLALVFIWSSPRLTSGAKLAYVGIIALLILMGTASLYLF
ncbi:hypothetical protein BGO17_02495 [Candidatus Saccharibacteria bacterium 49-20]|nr:MAG: hypothetical protein BGO17_02495 [Candidatus Saccharibacteria bacterium 49-20]